MKVKEVRQVRLPFLIIALIITSIVFLGVGYKIGKGKIPANCAELGVNYLEIGKNKLGITDFGSEEWKNLIEAETKFTNDCYESIREQD